MSGFIFNGSSRMRNVTFARDHHKTSNSIIEDARRQRLRREEEVRLTRAAQRVQSAVRRWLSGLAAMRLALDNVRRLPDDITTILMLPFKSAVAGSVSAVEEKLQARLHAACWCMSYAVTHPSRIPIHGTVASPPGADNEEEENAPISCKSLAEVQSYQQTVLQHYGTALCTALRSCAESTLSTNLNVSGEPSNLWQRLLSGLTSKDMSLLLYVLLQQIPYTLAENYGIGLKGDTNLLKRLIGQVVDAVAAHNAAFSRSLNEEDDGAQRGMGAATSCYSLIPTSPAHIDRWPAVQALAMSLELTSQEPALSHAWIRREYAAALQPLLSVFPVPPSAVPLNPTTTSATTASPPQTGDSRASSGPSPSSAFAQVCWQCMCAAFSDDEYHLLTTNPLTVLMSSTEVETATAAAAATHKSDGCCAVLIEECYTRTALDTRLTAGDEIGGIKGGPLRARVLGRLVRLLPHVQLLVSFTPTSAPPHAAEVVKHYLLSVSTLSERLCREPFFIESILADHYVYNTGRSTTLTGIAAVVAANGGASAASDAPRSQYRLLSSYLFSSEGGLRLLQLLTAEDEDFEQLRLQAVQKPTVEVPADASAPFADIPTTTGGGEVVSDDRGINNNNGNVAPADSSGAAGDFPRSASQATASASASPSSVNTGAGLAAAAVWPTSASAQQSPLEILCNIFAWPLFTFSKPDYSRYQQETLALCAKLVRTPQLLRRLWNLYWQSCVGLRAVLPPGPELQKLCTRPVWGEGGDEKNSVSTRRLGNIRGRRMSAEAAATSTAPYIATFPRLPTWETHPRYPMSFYDPHPSLSIFFFMLLAHYVNVRDFTDELRRGDTAVFTVEEACALILGLKEIVHRAHLYGVVPNSNGEAVAHAACLLLSRLHIVNEADAFVPADAEGLWISVGMAAAESAVGSIVSRWDEASAAVVDEEKAAVEEDTAAVVESTSLAPVTTAVAHWHNMHSTATTNAALVLSRLPGDDLMFHGSCGWDNKLRYIKLLVHTPFLLPFPARALLLTALLSLQEERWSPPSERPAVVHRGRTFVDTYDLFHDNPLSSNMYNIRFVSEDGTLEAGYGRGVYRECIVSLCKEGFATPYGLFQQTSDGYVFPNSFSAIATGDPQHLQKIRFLGAMVGRALHDGVLQDVPFAQHFRNAILGRRNTLSNLKTFDAELYHQLMSLTQLNEEELHAVGLTFVYTVNSLGVTKEVELVPGGAQMEVTPRNCLYYVHLVADFKLNREAADQTRAFCAGLHAVLDSNRLMLFDTNEVGKLFGGDESGEIDLQDWKDNTVYDKPEDENQPQVRLFWDVVESLTHKQQSQLLKFVTSMTRPPLLGFSFLSPPFKVQLLTSNVSCEDHLPSAATCFSTLKLPPYRDYATARAKIIAAIEETGTFEYS